MGFLAKLFGGVTGRQSGREHEASPAPFAIKTTKGPQSSLREFPLLYLHFDDYAELLAAVKTGNIEVAISGTMHKVGVTIQRAFAQEEGFLVLYRGDAVSLRLPDGTVLRRGAEREIVHWDATLEQVIAACTPESAQKLPGFDTPTRDAGIAARAPAVAELLSEHRRQMEPTIQAVRVRYGLGSARPSSPESRPQDRPTASSCGTPVSTTPMSARKRISPLSKSKGVTAYKEWILSQLLVYGWAVYGREPDTTKLRKQAFSCEFEDRDGRTPETAIVVHGAPDELVGVAAMDLYLSDRFGAHPHDWQMRNQSFGKCKNRSWTRRDVELANGTIQQLYFDITEFLGTPRTKEVECWHCKHRTTTEQLLGSWVTCPVCKCSVSVMPELK